MTQCKVTLETEREGYGFGHNYTLVATCGKQQKKFWLGQDAKVFSRALGMRMEDAIDHYSEKAGSRDFDKVKVFIAEDIVRANLSKKADDEITNKDIKKIMKAEAWGLAVQ